MPDRVWGTKDRPWPRPSDMDRDAMVQHISELRSAHATHRRIIGQYRHRLAVIRTACQSVGLAAFHPVDGDPQSGLSSWVKKIVEGTTDEEPEFAIIIQDALQLYTKSRREKRERAKPKNKGEIDWSANPPPPLEELSPTYVAITDMAKRLAEERGIPLGKAKQEIWRSPEGKALRQRVFEEVNSR